MLRGLYNWTMRLAEDDRAPYALFAVAFMESSFFPIPPHIMLIPMVLARRDRAWFYGLITTVGSVLGGIAGYAIGYFLFEAMGKPLFDFYGYSEKFASFASRYNDYGAWIVFIAGVTPFPYKVITIASGVTQLSFPVFLAASILSRGLIFFVIAGLLYWFGAPIRKFIERRLGVLTVLFVVLLIGGFVAIKFLS